MITVLSVIGTRPEAIKVAPVLMRLDDQPESIRSVICVTGQHREMLDQVMALFDIHPDYDLGVMQPNQSLAQLTASALQRLDPIITETNPDWLLAQGDTTTVLVAALAAYYHRIPFGHIEAGLRTGNRYAPFPEEMNRHLTDVLSERLYAPTEKNRQALVAEGISRERIIVTGNTVIDALLMVADWPYDWSAGPLAAIPHDKQIILLTAHRRESFGVALHNICLAVREMAQRFRSWNVHFVYPVHLNPHVQKPVFDLLSDVPEVSLVAPLDYLSLVHLMKRAKIILTDSGGIQEEAPSLRVPVLVLRNETERPEGIEAGVARLVGTDPEQIIEETERLLVNASAYAAMASGVNPYGDGRAAARIVSDLLTQRLR